MNKTIKLIIVILILIPGSFYFNNGIISNNSTIEHDQQLTDNTFSNTELNSIDNQAVQTNTNLPETTVTNNQDPEPNQWYSGETVRVDYQPKNATVKSLDYSQKDDLDFNLKWGTSGTGNGQFNEIYGLAVDSAGDVYVTDRFNHRVQKFDSTGTYLIQWGTSGTGNGQFNQPHSIAVDSAGDVYVTDYFNHRVQKFDSTGTYLTQWGSSGTGNGQFDRPWGITIDSAGDVYVIDSFNHRVQKFDSTGTYLTQWGSLGSGDGQFNNPTGINVDSIGNVYVTDRSNDRVQKFDSTGTYLTQWGTAGTGQGQFNEPYALASDSFGYIYVVDLFNRNVQKFDTSGAFIARWGASGTDNGQFINPTSITIDFSGNIYVGEGYLSHRVQKFQFTKLVIESIGFLPNAADTNYLSFDNTNSAGLYNRAYEFLYLGFTYYDMVTPAELGILFSWETKKSSIFTSIFESEKLTLAIDNSAVYSSNELKINFIISYGYGLGFVLEMYAFDTGLNQYVSSIVTSPVSYFDFENSIISIDYVWAESQEINSQIRSNYQYGDGDQKIHTLEINVFDYRIPLAIYSPMAWNLTSISPSATYIWDDINKYWSITNTVPTTYSIIFQSGPGWGVDYPRQDNIVAINDVSSDYTQCIGFECGNYQADWTNNGFETVSIDTSIVFDGSFSLKLEDTDGSTDYFEFYNLDAGEYYVSFNYYVIDTSNTIFFNYPNSDGLQYDTFIDTNTIKNRWHTYFTFIAFDDSTYNWVRFRSYLWNGEILIDNFKIFKASGQQSNLGLSEYEFSSQFIYWDGYKNPAATNINVEWSLRDRTADTEIISKSLITNSLGYAYYNFKGTLEMKEYESRWWSYASWFGTPWTKSDLWDLSQWSASVESTTDDYVQLETPSDRPYFNPSGTWDLSNADWLYLEGYWNVSSNYVTYLDTIVATETGIISNTWFTAIHEIDEDFSGSEDLTDITYVGLSYSGSAKLHRLRDLHLIQAQKNYFTPIPNSYVPYSHETKQDKSKNYFDFTEGTTEQVATSTYVISENVENGYLKQEYLAVSSTDYRYSRFETFSIDASYYTYLSIRFKTNYSLSYSSLEELRVYDGFWGSVVGTYEFGTIQANQYYEIEINLSLDPDWTGTETRLQILFFDNGNGAYSNDFAQDNPISIEFDYIQFVHKDTDHDQGYGWGFEESNYNDGWSTGAMGSTISTQNSYITLYTPTDYDGMIYTFENQDLSYFSYIDFIAKGDNTGSLLIQVSQADGGFEYLAFSITTEYQRFQLAITTNELIKSITFTNWAYGYYENTYIKSIRMLNNNPIGLYETDDYFYFRSENDSLVYYYELDNFQGYAFDNEIIWKNQTVGSHELYYTAIASTDPLESRYEFLQLQTSIYYYSYLVINEFNIQVQDFSLSDYYVQFQVASSKDYTYVVKFNGSSVASGSGLSTGTSIQVVRDITPGLIIVLIEFTNETETLSRTYSYSNAAQEIPDDLAIEGLKTPEYDVLGGLVSFFITTNWENTTITVYQNGSSLGSVAESGTLVFSFSNSPGIYNFTYLIDGGTDTFVFEDWLTIASPDLSLVSIFYDIVILDTDGYVFQDFPLLTYYNGTIISRNLIELRGNETFNSNLLTWGNEQGFSFNAINVTILESFTSNTFVVLIYLDLIRVHFENSGIYTTQLNLTRTPGNYSLAVNETIVIQQGGRDYWLPPGNYSALIFEQIPATNGTSTLTLSGSIDLMSVSAGLPNIYDATASTRDYNPDIDNDLSLGRFSTPAKILTGTIIVYFLLSIAGGEIWLWVKKNVFRKRRDESIISKPGFMNSGSSSRRSQGTTTSRRQTKMR